ncbi:MAG: nucleoside-triphosphatase [Dysgonamonadaceae bacterium]|nr:nucleoside-triphosphatase [Dysgonamonadaceae bacterium]MDD3355667.1 nucleoside-triphosphatase [Dysgonamonadaceae bacterium]MDD3728110.1 nucleoside-triphosphatase [Dysgonamonadaceae bacterium]MDD4246006.1 nucleoside-triphosphatase [Dysgonamonadaceae bacterium]MDD4605704.1 nucleoside-triphosphatase [Dysgonamonadaceae bacterium]
MKSIFIISGEKGSGKTAFLIDVLAFFQMNGFVVGGFVALHELQSDCYQIKDIKTNEQSPLMERIATFDHRPNHFKFFPKGVEVGNNCIKELLAHPPDIAIVDEIGGYELAGKLWSSSFTQLMESSVPLIFTTKARQLEGVVKKWKIKPTLIFHPVDFGDPQKAFERMKRFL